MKNKNYFIVLGILVLSLSLISASRLPTIGGDEDGWGAILNDYLSRIGGANATQLNLTMVNGTNIYSGVINSTHLSNDSVGDDEIDYSAVTISDFTNDANYLDKDEGGTIDGDLIVNGNFTLIGSYLNATVTNQYLNGSFLPEITNIFNLGSALMKWANLYVGNIYATSISSEDWSNVTITESQITDFQNYLNESYADTLYADISVTGDNESWNESYADTLYATIGSGGNESWNESYADTQYLNNDGDTATGNYTFNTNTLHIDSTNGRVGIGTTEPKLNFDATLILDSTDNFKSPISVSRGTTGTAQPGIGARINFFLHDDAGDFDEAATIGARLSDVTAGAVSSELVFQTRAEGGAYQDQMVIDENGNVGIGTTSPQAALHIGNGDLILDKTANPRFSFYESGTEKVALRRVGPGIGLTLLNTHGYNTALNIDLGDLIVNTGNVGIGTTSPSSLLHLYTITDENANIRIDSAVAVRVANDVLIASSIGNSYRDEVAKIQVQRDGSLGQGWNFIINNYDGDSSEAMRISTNGNVGIGTTDPDSLLHVKGSIDTNMIIEAGASNNAELYYYNDGIMSWRIGETASGAGFRIREDKGNGDIFRIEAGAPEHSLRLDSDGNVGIGTTDPDHDLEIGTGTYSEIDAGESQFDTSSSRTFKENIENVSVDGLLDKIAKIPVTTYDFRDEYCNKSGDKCHDKIGLIAEDFHIIFGRGDDKMLSGQEVQMALWMAVQELKEENEALKELICLDHKEAEVCQ